MTFYYTQPNNRHKVHIVRDNNRYTLCYREISQDISEDEPEQGEKCSQCYAIKEAQETGVGIPF